MSKNLEEYIKNYGSIFWSVNHSKEIYTGGEVKELFSLIESVKNRDQKSILDLGGGNGYFSRILSKYFKRVINLDINERLIEQSKRINPSIEHIAGNLMGSGIESNSIDVILILNTFQYINKFEYKVFIDEMRRILKPEGVIVFNYSGKKAKKKTFKRKLLGKLSNIKKNYRNLSFKNFFLFIKYFFSKNTISDLLDIDIEYFEDILKKEKIDYETIKYYNNNKTHYILKL
jgi:ubiquinone/menaquinone biosynthesis C-methylase UbiE